MRKKIPTIPESAAALHQRMTHEKDGKKRQRLQALHMVASGYVHSRKALATLLGVRRHSVAAWLNASAEGGLEKALPYQIPRPPSRRRITTTALTALPER